MKLTRELNEKLKITKSLWQDQVSEQKKSRFLPFILLFIFASFFLLHSILLKLEKSKIFHDIKKAIIYFYWNHTLTMFLFIIVITFISSHYSLLIISCHFHHPFSIFSIHCHMNLICLQFQWNFFLLFLHSHNLNVIMNFLQNKQPKKHSISMNYSWQSSSVSLFSLFTIFYFFTNRLFSSENWIIHTN